MNVKFGPKRVKKDWRGATCTSPILDDNVEIGQLVRFNTNPGAKSSHQPWEIIIRSVSYGKKLTLPLAKERALEILGVAPPSAEKQALDEVKYWAMVIRTAQDTLVLGEARCVKVDGKYIIETPKLGTFTINEADVLECTPYHRVKSLLT